MTIELVIRIVAGALVLLSLALGASTSPIYHTGYWLWVAAFVGFSLFQSGFTGFCPMEILLNRMGVRAASKH
jgi:Protein of unknown function (DUF2892)